MSALAATSTSDFLGVAQKLVSRFRRSSQTSVNVNAVSKDVGRVITAWNDPTVSATKLTAPTQPSDRFPQTPAEAVDHIAGILGLTQDRVCNAARVAPRTYYGWKVDGHRPRPQSLGRLWPLTEAVHFMAQAHPNLSAWFDGNKEAQALFDAGDVRALVQLELTWAMRVYPKRTRLDLDFGDGSDSSPTTAELPDGTTDNSHRPRRPSGVQMDDVAEVNLARRTTRRS